MKENKFGFKINNDRQFDLDKADRSIFRKLTLIEPSIWKCIFCGSCSSTCTASKFTDLSFRLISLNLRRGNVKDVTKMSSLCMLCGKCTMVCPRDVNIRHIMVLLKKEFNNEL